MTTQSKKMSDSELDTLRKAICRDLITLHEQSETYGGQARTLYYALGAYLRERGILAGAYLIEKGQDGGSRGTLTAEVIMMEIKEALLRTAGDDLRVAFKAG
jgi:hypothetical protein